MARKTCIFYSGALYHVMLRGNHGEKIFFSDTDRNYFYKLLDDGIKRFDYRVHAFCLMSNHVHLALQVNNTSLSKIIQNLAFRYARWVNKRTKRLGHLFQGRHKAILIDTDTYLLDLVRYIHLNPVRAHIVSSPELYSWSSHLTYLDRNQLSWLSTDYVMSFFSFSRQQARKNYLNFMLTEQDESLDKLLYSGNNNKYDALGDEAFMKNVLFSLSSSKQIKIPLSEIINIICDFYSLTVEQLRTPSRRRNYSKVRTLIALLAKELNITTPTTRHVISHT